MSSYTIVCTLYNTPVLQHISAEESWDIEYNV